MTDFRPGDLLYVRKAPAYSDTYECLFWFEEGNEGYVMVVDVFDAGNPHAVLVCWKWLKVLSSRGVIRISSLSIEEDKR